MNVHTTGRKKADDGSISFPPLQCWNPVTKVATIAAQVGGRRVSCRIKIDDLSRRFDFMLSNPMQSVNNYRSEIERAARSLIEKNDFEEDGSIMIRYKDI